MDAPHAKRLKPNRDSDEIQLSDFEDEMPELLQLTDQNSAVSSSTKPREIDKLDTNNKRNADIATNEKTCSSDSDDEMPALINLSDPATKISQSKRTVASTTPIVKELTVLSWNIDGLDDRAIETRSYGVFEFIHRHSPDVILLQEVVDKNLNVFEQLCSTKYYITVHKIAPYYNAIFVKKCDHVEKMEVKNVEFDKTGMGRYLMIQSLSFKGVPFTMMTTHLESCAKSADIRKAQLRRCFDAMQEHKSSSNVILCGDLNIREKEMTALGGPPSGIRDSWVVCGGDKDQKFTWDLQLNDNKVFDGFQPRARYDRMFFTSKESDGVSCKTFELIGRQRISSCGLFPSDHFGLLVKFSLDV